MTGSARAAHGVVAGLALAALIAQYTVLVAGQPPAVAIGHTIRLLSFFTVLSNAMVAGTCLVMAFARRGAAAGLRTAVALYILVVLLIYQLLLDALIHPQGIHWWINQVLHHAVPLGYLLCWIAWPPHGGIGARAPLRWLIVPALYGAWTVAHGLASGWYPYPFLNIATHGGAAVARNMVLVALLFLALGYLLRWIDMLRAVDRRRAGR